MYDHKSKQVAACCQAFLTFSASSSTEKNQHMEKSKEATPCPDRVGKCFHQPASSWFWWIWSALLMLLWNLTTWPENTAVHVDGMCDVHMLKHLGVLGVWERSLDPKLKAPSLFWSRLPTPCSSDFKGCLVKGSRPDMKSMLCFRLSSRSYWSQRTGKKQTNEESFFWSTDNVKSVKITNVLCCPHLLQFGKSKPCVIQPQWGLFYQALNCVCLCLHMHACVCLSVAKTSHESVENFLWNSQDVNIGWILSVTGTYWESIQFKIAATVNQLLKVHKWL